MEDVQESVKQTRDHMVALSRSILSGLDDLAAGRVYGRTSGSEVGRPRPNRLESSVATAIEERQRQRRAEASESSSEGGSEDRERAEGSGSQLSEEEVDSTSDNSDDSFLDFHPDDLAENFEDDGAHMRQAQIAQKHAESLVKKIKVNERVELMEQVSSWYQKHIDPAEKEMENLAMQVDFREEVQKAFRQGLTSLREAISGNELSILVKVHKFLQKLHKLGTQTKEEDKQQRLAQQRWSTVDRANRLQRQIARAREELMEATKEGEEEAVEVQKPKPALTAADLLKIVADQQAELAALSTSNALAKQRIATIQVCNDFLKSTQAAKSSGVRVAAAPADQDASEVYQEVKRGAMRSALRKRMEEDDTFCRSVWRAAEASKIKGLVKKQASGDSQGDAADDPQMMELQAGNADLEQEVEQLRAMKESGDVGDEVIEILANAGKLPSGASSLSSSPTGKAAARDGSLADRLKSKMEEGKSSEKVNFGEWLGMSASERSSPSKRRSRKSLFEEVGEDETEAESEGTPQWRSEGSTRAGVAGVAGYTGTSSASSATRASTWEGIDGNSSSAASQALNGDDRSQATPQQSLQDPEELRRLRLLQEESERLKLEASQLEAKVRRMRKLRASVKTTMFLNRASVAAAAAKAADASPADPPAPTPQQPTEPLQAKAPEPDGERLSGERPGQPDAVQGSAAEPGCSETRREPVRKEEVQEAQDFNKKLLEQLQLLDARLVSAKQAADTGGAKVPAKTGLEPIDSPEDDSSEYSSSEEEGDSEEEDGSERSPRPAEVFARVSDALTAAEENKEEEAQGS